LFVDWPGARQGAWPDHHPPEPFGLPGRVGGPSQASRPWLRRARVREAFEL